MLYNFTFEEAMKVLYNEEGWVQGERFGKNTYIAYDKKEDCFVLNAVNAEDHVDPKLSDSTLAVWGSISDITIDKYLVGQKYRFGLSTLFQTNFFRLFFRYCTGV